MFNVKGTLQTGLRHFEQRMKDSPQVFSDATGVTLYPGTLNIRVDRKILIQRDFSIPDPKPDEPDQVLLFENCLIDGIPAFRIRPFNVKNGSGGHGDEILEITCKEKLPNAKPGRVFEITFFRDEFVEGIAKSFESGEQWATEHGGWNQMVNAHADDFPEISDFFPGTLNVNLLRPQQWIPPFDTEHRLEAREKGRRTGIQILRNGNYIHPGARVTSINEVEIDGRIYYPGPPEDQWKIDSDGCPLPVARPRIEILCRENLRAKLGMQDLKKDYEVRVTLRVDAQNPENQKLREGA